MMHIIWSILLLSVAVFAVAQLLPQIRIKSFGTAITVAIVYGLLSYFFGWLLMFLTLPLMFLTLGLFKFVINAFLLWLTDKFIEDFEIETLGMTLIAAFLITIFDSLLHWIF